MAYKEKSIEKKYYTLTEVSQKLQIPISKLRFWEKHLELPSNQNTARYKPKKYTSTDIAAFERLQDLSQNQGYTLKGAKAILSAQKLKKHVHVIHTLKALRVFLLHLARQQSPKPSNPVTQDESK